MYGHVSGAALSWQRDDDGLDLVEATVGGRQPAPSEAYVVAAPSLEFYADDLYPVLDEDHIEADHGTQHDALVGYAREHGIDAETDGRMQVIADTASNKYHSLR
ncbi:hypothetical protein [Halovenus salina]|uniref:Uncharacterized protein n=1 Tax=Halovenus salina TaxID=1510225 RepID=A0ABD5W1Q7_9EURY|nr:hypothetical protein [Halovenus salina]